MDTSLRVTTCQARNTFPLMEGVTRHLVKELGVSAEYVDNISWQERYEQLSCGDMHLVWICARPFAEALAAGTHDLDGLAVPVMQGELYEGKPVYYSYLVVHRDQPANSLEELAGARAAFNEPDSQSGYHSLVGAARHLGRGHFAEWIESGGHATSLQMLAERKADVAAIDSTFWEYEQLHAPQVLEELRTIGLLGPFPAPPLVVHKSVDADLREQMRRSVLSMHLDPRHRELLQQSQVERFVPVDMDSYGMLLQ